MDPEQAALDALIALTDEQRARVLRYVHSRWPGPHRVTFSDVEPQLLALVCIEVLDKFQKTAKEKAEADGR